MSFFNKKEEVLEVILTSYGKYKLSKGKWAPKYYAFFDEDIIYDSRYTGQPEISGTTEARIQEQTPALRAQTSYSDLPKQVKKLTRRVKSATPSGRSFGVGAQDAYASALLGATTRAPYILPLGNSAIVSERLLYIPSWEIKALKNEFTASMAYASSSYENITKIPQLKVDIDYTTKIYKNPNPQGKSDVADPHAEDEQWDYNDPVAEGLRGTPSELYLTTYFKDETMIVVDDNYLVIEVNEQNSALAVDQFYLEVWEVTEDETLQPRDRTGQSLERMSFVKYPKSIVNDILLDPRQVPRIDITQIDDSYIEYFMDILTDEEIGDTTVCNYIATDEKNRLAWSRVLSCYEAIDDSGAILYTSEDTQILEELCGGACE